MKRNLPSGLWLSLIMPVFSLLILLPGCRNEEPAPDAAVQTDAAGTTATTGITVSQRNPTVKSITDDVSGIRGLPVKKEISVDYLNRDQLKDEVKKEIDKDYPPAEVSKEERALKVMGLLNPQENLMDEITKMLGEETIGYYDDQTKQLVVVSDKPELDVMNEVTLSHEITHALQDQSFDLEKVAPSGGPREDDELAARLALVEGDATVSMQEYAENKLSFWEALGLGLGSLGTPGGDAAGTYLEDSLTFSYTYGANFVSYLKKQGGWKAVDAAYLQPPDSTEQIIHPEKYAAKEQPAPVELPDIAGIAGPGWDLVNDGTVGEFDVSELLATQLQGGVARRAAAGWGGGAARYYEDVRGRPLLVMELKWDTQRDADEFAEAMATCLQDRYQVSFDFGGQWPGLDTADGSWVMEENGAAVVAVLSPDISVSGQLADKIVGLKGGSPRHTGSPDSVMVSAG